MSTARLTQAVLTTNQESEDLAMAELRAAATTARVAGELGPGVLLVEFETPFAAVAGAWQAAPPIFVRHIAPAEARLVIDLDPRTGEADGETLLIRLLDVVRTDFLPRFGSTPFAVQARIFDTRAALRPFEVNEALAGLIGQETGAALDVQSPAQVLSVMIGSLGGELVALLGLSQVGENLSDWAGGARRFAREETQVSRAEFKLLEALEIFGIYLAPRSLALDLGAAPGGWTRILRARGLLVTAVDPAALDPRVAADRGVRYKRMTAQQYLLNEPDRFDVIVNDMRMDARDSARLMISYAPYLFPDGIALMTLKLPGTNRRRVIEDTMRILRERYTVLGARQLFHNRSEITAYLRR
jgi:23S rRNA (cytidine2498-2'-O)-methyltransferase